MIKPQILCCPVCSEDVVYEPQLVGFGKYTPKDRIRIYLTCPRGHQREYVVSPQDDAALIPKDFNKG